MDHIIGKIVKKHNVMAETLGQEKISEESCEIISKEKSTFINKAFHINNGVYSSKDGTEIQYIVQVKDHGQYYVLEYSFKNEEKKVYYIHYQG